MEAILQPIVQTIETQKVPISTRSIYIYIYKQKFHYIACKTTRQTISRGVRILN